MLSAQFRELIPNVEIEEIRNMSNGTILVAKTIKKIGK